MKSLWFRQLVACTVMFTVLFGTVAPLGACWCPGCHCENSVSRGLAKTEADPRQPETTSCCSIKKCCSDKKSCCADVTSDDSDGCCETVSGEKCCGCGKPDGKCLCGDLQKTVAIVPDTVSPVQKLNVAPAWDIAMNTVSLADSVGDSGWSIFLEHQGLRYSPPVPLHVWLCVFLN